MPVQPITPTTDEDREFKLAYQKFQLGDPISDRFLDLLITRLQVLEHNLHLLGPDFRLAWAEVSRSLTTLERMKLSREQR